ncbi:MAG: hypothetical protein KC912_20955 [Proteobacteria bacterium]|nr:hypothetical protein [Pseudomonadota bacterium]
MTDPLDRILALVREHIPDVRLVHKHELRWMRILGKAVRPIAPDFDTHYTTVLGRTVYLPRPPEHMPRRVLAATLAHELVHQLDQRRWGLLFYASYAWALPTGRTMRAYWERRAYAVDLLIAKERGGALEVENVARRLADVFSGSGYLWMWMGRASARAFLRPTVEAVMSGELERQAPYDVILAAWRGPEPPDEAA